MRVFALAALVAGTAAATVDWSSSYASLETTTLTTCPPGTWRKSGVTSGQNCFACLPGQFAEGTNQPKCTKCQAGRFSKQHKAISRVVCTQCPRGTYWPQDGPNTNTVGGTDDCRDLGGNPCSCSNLSDHCFDLRVCTTCEAGRYQAKTGSRSCFDCEPGTFREETGGTSEMSCTRCDMKTFDYVKVGPDQDQYVYGATKLVETCKYRPVDCKVTAWGPYSRCNRNCGGGTQTKKRSQINAALHGGQECKDLEHTRSCNTHPCSDMGDRFPSYDELKNGLWWKMTFDKHDYGAALAAGMTAQCRYQKNEPTGPNRWELPQTVENVQVSDSGSSKVVSSPVEGFCCRATSADEKAIGKTWCYSAGNANEINFWNTIYTYSATTGKMCDPNTSNCASFKPIIVHKRRCKEMTCVVEEHSCTQYKCPKGVHHNNIPGWCPNKGHHSCTGTHKSLRVTHSVNEEEGGHYCLITDKATNKCECFCLDLYQTQSVEKAIITPHFNEDVQEHGKRWVCPPKWTDPGCSPSCDSSCTSTASDGCGNTRTGQTFYGSPCCVPTWTDPGCSPSCGSSCTSTESDGCGSTRTGKTYYGGACPTPAPPAPAPSGGCISCVTPSAPWTDKLDLGFNADMTCFTATKQSSELCATDASILIQTSAGWVTMENLAVGTQTVKFGSVAAVTKKSQPACSYIFDSIEHGITDRDFAKWCPDFSWDSVTIGGVDGILQSMRKDHSNKDVLHNLLRGNSKMYAAASEICDMLTACNTAAVSKRSCFEAKFASLSKRMQAYQTSLGLNNVAASAEHALHGLENLLK